MSTHCYATMKISLSELVTETLEVGRIRNFVLVISDKCYISLVHGLCLSGVSRNFHGGGGKTLELQKSMKVRFSIQKKLCIMNQIS